ncbi:hypothetical protein HII31_05220 [Pseudocercospora fuligena]|uniref:Ecp2 effector protein domain-containing protein n=1 Tax=Pseudocercospora fuligena TaxID=685502 RepID=A0A8H6RKE3_9PEZI|nr:hypothetical protein HII31_05220 [Pseudocercospora fuligena]
MQLSKLLTTTLAVMASAQSPGDLPMNEKHIMCRSGPGGSAGTLHTAQVGYPYENGGGCAAILDTIEKHIAVPIEDYRCEDDGFGDTFISLSTQNGQQDLLSAALWEIYPDERCCTSCKNSLIGKTSAAALSARAVAAINPIEEHHIDCRSTDLSGGDFMYWAQTGFPYNQGGGCDSIRETIKKHVYTGFSFYHCVDDNFGNTALYFWAQGGAQDALNVALKEAYPEAQGSWDCHNTVYQ